MKRFFYSMALLGFLGNVTFAEEVPVYILAKVTVTDQDGYEEYRSGFGEVFQEHEGEILAANIEPTVLEGNWEATVTVLMSFKSRTKALEWYYSEGYQELVRIRELASSADFVLMDGR